MGGGGGIRIYKESKYGGDLEGVYSPLLYTREVNEGE